MSFIKKEWWKGLEKCRCCTGWIALVVHSHPHQSSLVREGGSDKNGDDTCILRHLLTHSQVIRMKLQKRINKKKNNKRGNTINKISVLDVLERVCSSSGSGDNLSSLIKD
jgi:hypothetical protein